MTIGETLLQKLANWRPNSASDRLNLLHEASGWSVTLVAEQVETMGCRLHEITLARQTSPATLPTLEEQARHISSRVTGLLEPLRLVEIDSPHGVALLRSHAPAVRGETRSYYEVLRHNDGTTRVNRYDSMPAGGKRQVVPFTLTNEALAKLVTDLATV
jgi:hypothetical protein